MDSDHRSYKQQIYSLPPLATRELLRIMKSSANAELFFNGAGNRTRTYDLLITNQLLYQLSYASIFNTRLIYHFKVNLSSNSINFLKENGRGDRT